MDLTSAAHTKGRYIVVQPIFFNDDVIGVLEGRYVLGTVNRRSLTAYRIDRRTSFKHPVVGLILGLAMAGVPGQAVAGDPLGLWWLTLASPFRLIGSAFMFFFGLFLLWGVVRRRDEPWLILVTAAGERAFPLEAELPSEATLVLDTLCACPAHADPIT